MIINIDPENNAKNLMKISVGYHTHKYTLKNTTISNVERMNMIMSDDKKKVNPEEPVMVELSDIMTEANGLSVEIISEETVDDNKNGGN